MKLFSSPTSPFVRKALVLLRESGNLDAVEMSPSGGSPLDASKMPVDQNPLGKIPALVLDDGTSIFDSRVITRYLNDHFKAGLYPEGDALWTCLTQEAMADGMVDAAILIVYESRLRPEDKQFTPWIDGQWAKVSRALDHLNANVADLEGPLTMGQIAVACTLSYLDFRHGTRNWREGRAALAAWEAEIAKRPSIAATVPVE